MIVPESAFGQALERLMENYRDPETGERRKLTVTDVARVANIPRSTVHRHLKGGRPIRSTLKAYACALGVAESELALIAGYRHPMAEGLPEDVKALALEIGKLDEEQRALLWQVYDLILTGQGLTRVHAN